MIKADLALQIYEKQTGRNESMKKADWAVQIVKKYLKNTSRYKLTKKHTGR